MSTIWYNALAFLFSVVLVGVYHLYLGHRLRRDPQYTIQAVNRQARKAWVENIMSDSDAKGILGVQTLRNSTMAATFLASTAVLLVIGVLNLLQKGDAFGAMLGSLNADNLPDNLRALKLLPLLVVSFGAFFFFSLAVRMYNHVGYLLNASNRRFCPNPAYVASLLNRSGEYYSLGMRAFYLCVPLVFWLFGAWYLLAASFALVGVLYHVDRAPDVFGGTPDHRESVPGADGKVLQHTSPGHIEMPEQRSLQG